jgi:1,2-phenylacetyl-CoA epoxidase PaaB subunit
MSTLTPALQQVLAELNKAQERIKPAVMADTPANGLALSKYLTENNLAPTAENFYTAINALVSQHPQSLTWVVKPAKLVAMEKNERPATHQSAEQATKPFTDKVKTAEIADAKAKANEASITQAKDLISAYLPTKSTPMGQRLDYADQALMQAEWTKALNQAIEKKRNLQEWVKVLAETIRKRYSDRERASERSQ